MTPAQKAVRLRLKSDFEYYARTSLKIRTKPPNPKIAPLILNRAQRHLLSIIDRQMATRGYVRVIILKARQMGLSTMIEAWLYWWVSQRQAQKAMVVTHEGKATTNLFDMARRYHRECPEILRPHTTYSSRKELVFDILDSSYAVATAGSDSVGRSETLTCVHMSEGAFWPKSVAKENRSGLLDALSQSAGTAAFDESTANGVSGEFYENWVKASKGESEWECCFTPWHWAPEYRADPGPNFERTELEQKLVDEYGLDDEQLMFRRIRIAEKGAPLFAQEYPSCAEEAFLTSGRPVFHPERVADLAEKKKAPVARKALEGTEWNDHPLGELKCFLPHDEHETYYVGADVGMGVKKDFSVAQIFNAKKQQAAVWRSDRVDPDYFGTVVANLGRYYNNAQLIIERNGPGILTNRVVHKDESYPWCFQETSYDKVTDTETTHVGFLTSEKSKSLIIGELRATIRNLETEIYDEDTLNELRTYVVTESGKMEAERGTNDDTVIALALVNHIHEGVWEPIKNHDEFYVSID